MKITKLPNGGEMRDYGDYQAWYLNGQLHRTDGPAYVNGDRQEWYLNGVAMTEAEHAAKVAAMSHDECLRPKYKVGEDVGYKNGAIYTVREIVVSYRMKGKLNAFVWPEDELSPLDPHVHQFVCAECGESK